jgi:coenzyme F420 biosynthesis associated uncharacterized protein
VAVIDWGLARTLATTVASEPARPVLGADLSAMAQEAERLVGGYTRLKPTVPLPRAEALTRSAWIDANLHTVRDIVDPLADKVGSSLGPLQGPVRAVAGYAIAAEIGVVFGFMGQRVLGQYELALLNPATPPRLLFVAPNLGEAIDKLDVDRDDFLRWVALHEVTHALQFGGVPWLREHMAGMLRDLLDRVQLKVDAPGALRLPGSDDLRGLVEQVRNGDILSAVTTPEQRAIIDRLQATMAVIEGYAEHVMDAVGARVLPSLPALRAAMDKRRATASPIAKLLQRLLGLEMKLRQYQQGKRFCDAVVEAEGLDALNRVWRSPDAMPSPAEIDDPEGWRKRTRVLALTA